VPCANYRASSSAQNTLTRPAIGTHQGFAHTLEEPGDLATEAIVNKFLGFFKSIMIGKAQRYPTLAHHDLADVA
jgi:hypothetical protein